MGKEAQNQVIAFFYKAAFIFGRAFLYYSQLYSVQKNSFQIHSESLETKT